MTQTKQLPPQAYTRETLANAYEWLSQQPEHIRRVAKNSDVLVGLYLQHQRRSREGFSSGAQMVDKNAPVSSEKFKSELKDLALGLDEFSEPISPTESKTSASVSQPWPPHVSQPVTEPHPGGYMPQGAHFIGREPMMGAYAPHSSPSVAPPPSQAYPPGIAPPQGQVEPHNLSLQLDPATREKVLQVRAGFNLSSDVEALRMLVSIGFEQAQRILPR